MKFGLALGLVLVTGGALALRLPQLDQRPLHTDESVHAIKFLGLWEGGDYRYDPHEYHGPSLYYATLPLVWASGAKDRGAVTETLLRLTPVLFGACLILLLALARPLMGTGAAMAAGLLTACSPVMVFYSRYYIHETLLVTFTFGFVLAAWRYAKSGRCGWAIGAGVCLGLMQATKETFVFNLAAAAGATAAAAVWRRLRCEPQPTRRWKVRDLVWGLGAAGVVSTVFFTSFFTNWQGPVDAWRTYLPWLARAEGASPHIHSWSYYWGLLLWTHRGSGPVWTEVIILGLGVVGWAASFRPGRPGPGDRDWGRWLGFYTLLLSLIYTLIPYKTPWCVLGFWHGWILLAGLGAVAVWRWSPRLPWRAAWAAVLSAGMVHLAVQAHRAAFRYADSQRNPYVYAHTLSSVLDLVERVNDVMAASPDGRRTVIRVMVEGGDYWPLPWYLRRYPVGWYPGVPAEVEQVNAAILIFSPQFEPRLAEILGDRMTPLGMFGLRPSVFLQFGVEPGLWSRYLESRRDP